MSNNDEKLTANATGGKAASGRLKQPRQQRSKQIVRAIVQACRKIMDEEGPDALNTNHIAEVAGVNIASLYRWFPNKEAIISETFEEQVAAEIDELFTIYDSHIADGQCDLAEAFGRLVVDPLISRQIRFLSMHACFYQENQSSFDVGQRTYEIDGLPLIEWAGKWLASTMASQRPELSSEQCEQRAFIATRTAQALCLSAATERPEWLRTPSFRQHIFKLLLPYLEDKESPHGSAT